MAALRRSWIFVILVAIVNPFYGLPGGVRKSFASGPDCCSCTPWAGIYPTVLMPFCHDGQIDAPSLERQIHFHVRGGVRGVLVYCADHHCSHSVAMNADRWADDVRLSDVEPRFVCKACGKRGAILRGGSEPIMRVR